MADARDQGATAPSRVCLLEQEAPPPWFPSSVCGEATGRAWLLIPPGVMLSPSQAPPLPFLSKSPGWQFDPPGVLRTCSRGSHAPGTGKVAAKTASCLLWEAQLWGQSAGEAQCRELRKGHELFAGAAVTTHAEGPAETAALARLLLEPGGPQQAVGRWLLERL